MTALRPLGAQLWTPGTSAPRLSKYDSPEWTLAMHVRRYRIGYATAILSQYKGRDFAYAPELVAEFKLERETTVSMRWALQLAATAAYHQAAGEVS